MHHATILNNLLSPQKLKHTVRGGNLWRNTVFCGSLLDHTILNARCLPILTFHFYLAKVGCKPRLHVAVICIMSGVPVRRGKCSCVHSVTEKQHVFFLKKKTGLLPFCNYYCVCNFSSTMADEFSIILLCSATKPSAFLVLILFVKDTWV